MHLIYPNLMDFDMPRHVNSVADTFCSKFGVNKKIFVGWDGGFMVPLDDEAAVFLKHRKSIAAVGIGTGASFRICPRVIVHELIPAARIQ